jgi:hypothetical protein
MYSILVETELEHSSNLYFVNLELENSLVNSRLSTLMQLLFSFDQAMKVEKTLMQTLAC